MAARPNYVKLGLFVILAVGTAVLVAIGVGAQAMRRETIPYLTYFVESVQGLEVGAPVKARGVTIGQVGHITFAPDHQMVEVRSDLDVPTLKAMGLKTEHPPSNARAQLASQGLIGTRFIAIDFFDPKTHPAPPLTFPTPDRYIPATWSVQKSLEVSATNALDRLAQVMDTIVRDGLTEKALLAVTHADEAIVELGQTVKRLNREKIPERTAKAIEDARVALSRINKAVDRVDGDAGLIASAQGALASFGEVGRNTAVTTRDLGGTLEDVRAAATAIRGLAEELERNPDMLVKGVARPRAP